MVGYGIFLGCGLLLMGICLYARKKGNRDDTNSMIRGDGSVGGFTLTFSVLAAWMWTTSIFGASETYALYGIWGPISYVAGACIAFAGLIAFLAFLRRRFARSITWLGFLQVRYGRRTKLFYYIFAIIAPGYVLIEQAVGIGYLLESFYGSSFRVLSFLSVLIGAGFVFFGGMKAVLEEERITASIILAAFAAGAIFVLTKGDAAPVSAAQIPAPAEGLGELAVTALRYFIMAIVIAFGQIVFDPAYYIKANLAADTKTMGSSYILGGIVLWGGITLISSLYLGRAAFAAGTDVAALFGGVAKVIFSIVIIFIGISTIAHFMIGFLGVFSLDLYEEASGIDGSDRDRMIFGRILIAATAVFCASMAIALEDISLLTIDIFCAIFFAAPCVPLVMGCFTQRNFGKLPMIASLLGIIGGLTVWLAAPGSVLQNQFVGLAASLLISLLIMLGGFVNRLPYDRG